MLDTTLVNVRAGLSLGYVAPRPNLLLYCFAVLLGASSPTLSSPYCPLGWLLTQGPLKIHKVYLNIISY